MTKKEKIAEVESGVDRKRTPRGFQVIEFKDRYGISCTLQQSSLADYTQPGSSAVWLGVEDIKPQVMASEASQVGIVTDVKCGWVPYPIPPQVMISSRMHLDVKQVEWLVAELQGWLRTGSFEK